MVSATLPLKKKFFSVVVPKEWFYKLPKPDDREVVVLNELQADVKSEYSRIGSQIKVTKELDGITVYIPDPLPLMRIS